MLSAALLQKCTILNRWSLRTCENIRIMPKVHDFCTVGVFGRAKTSGFCLKNAPVGSPKDRLSDQIVTLVCEWTFAVNLSPNLHIARTTTDITNLHIARTTTTRMPSRTEVFVSTHVTIAAHTVNVSVKVGTRPHILAHAVRIPSLASSV